MALAVNIHTTLTQLDSDWEPLLMGGKCGCNDISRFRRQELHRRNRSESDFPQTFDDVVSVLRP